MKMLLFQYGSNMKQRRLEEKINSQVNRYAPSDVLATIEMVGRAAVRGWQFRLGGHNSAGKVVCDMVEAPYESTVWGALYQLDRQLVLRSDGNRSVLDRIEGHRRDNASPDTYRPTCVEVEWDGSGAHAWTYVCSPTARRCPPECPHTATEGYINAVLVGAVEIGLPEDYQDCLREACRRVQHAGGG